MVVLSSAGAEFASVGEVLDHMLRVAFSEIGIRRLEVTLLETWVGAAEAARELGFQVEGRFPEACFVAGQYRDLLLLGILAGEWKR
jgi:RimJ/RimL family protein N-acetyltransferase